MNILEKLEIGPSQAEEGVCIGWFLGEDTTMLSYMSSGLSKNSEKISKLDILQFRAFIPAGLKVVALHVRSPFHSIPFHGPHCSRFNSRVSQVVR